MSLQGDGAALGVPFPARHSLRRRDWRRFGVVNDHAIIDSNDDVFVLRADFHLEPLVFVHGGLVQVFDHVKAAGLAVVAGLVVELRFETVCQMVFGVLHGIIGVKENTRIGDPVAAGRHFQFEIREAHEGVFGAGADIEKMRRFMRCVDANRAVGDGP